MEALSVAISVNSGATLVYSARVMDAYAAKTARGSSQEVPLPYPCARRDPASTSLLFGFGGMLAGGIQVSGWAIFLLVLAPQLTVLAQLGLSRAREYHADVNAALLTRDPRDLASALAKIERRQHRFMDWVLPG